MYFKYNAFLSVFLSIYATAACVSSHDEVFSRRNADSDGGSDTDDAIEAGVRLKPAEAERIPSQSSASATQTDMDAQIKEPQSESPRGPRSLFSEPIKSVGDADSTDDDAGLVASIAPDAAKTSPSTDATASTDSAPIHADSQTPRIPAPDAPGEIVITEVMPNPKALPDTQGEWFEIYNASATETYNLRGCEIADDSAVKCAVTADLNLPPHGWATVARNPSPGFRPTYVCSSLSLTNADPDQVIVRCGGTVIDRMTYAKAKEAASLALDIASLDALTNDDPAAWCLSTAAYNGEDLGTPGVPNSPCAK
jgi:hypothetical protein